MIEDPKRSPSVDLAKLATQLEMAAEGSEYLDYAIQRRFGIRKPVPAYTSSLDAAMAIVPPGWSIHRLQRRHDCRGGFAHWTAELYRADNAVLDVPTTVTAATAPLAVAASALRVLAAEDQIRSEGSELRTA